MKETILIIDDDEVSRLVLKRCFCEYNIIETSSGSNALKLIEENHENIDVIVCDVVMPKFTGLQLLHELNNKDLCQDIPFIVISNYLENQLEALELGAWDYITKDTDINIIKSRVKNALIKGKLIESRKESLLKDKMFNLFTNLSNDFAFDWNLNNDTVFYCGNYYDYYNNIISHNNFSSTINRGLLIFEEDIEAFHDAVNKIGRKNNRADIDVRIVYQHEIIWCKISIAASFKAGQIHNITCLFTNIDEYKKKIISVLNSSEKDSLTGLMNRKTFKQNAIRLIDNEVDGLAFIFIDIDNFKKINDSYGHMVGDEILKYFGQLLSDAFSSNSYISRHGGDEFFILLTGVENKQVLAERLDCLLNRISHPVKLNNLETYNYTVSVGACIVKNKATINFDKAYEISDKACYISKNNGKNQYTIVDWK